MKSDTKCKLESNDITWRWWKENWNHRGNSTVEFNFLCSKISWIFGDSSSHNVVRNQSNLLVKHNNQQPINNTSKQAPHSFSIASLIDFPITKTIKCHKFNKAHEELVFFFCCWTLNVDGEHEIAEHCNYREMVMKRA